MMTDLKSLLTLGAIPEEKLHALVAQYEWCSLLRMVRYGVSGVADTRLELLAPWRAESTLLRSKIDLTALRCITAEDVIDRFLREEDLRIIAQEGDADGEVQLQAHLEEEDELVSEPLAEIYLTQGFRDRAIAIYRRLSLLNPEKSVYFAELIAKIENNN